MSLQLKFTPYTLKFNFAAGTSRGVFHEKTVWFIKLYQGDDPLTFGLGEVAPIDRLSVDYSASFEVVLGKLATKISSCPMPAKEEEVFDRVEELVPRELPSVRFALETAMLDLINGGSREIFKNAFFRKEKKIPINGLVWMGDEDFMKGQIDLKIKSGFNCIKIKIGALDFETECKLLGYIRQNYPGKKLTVRVDANGAFRTEECMLKLKALEKFDLHSIEQPIMPRQPESMALLCIKTKLPIALDEELIGINGKANKTNLLNEIKPAYIILKPGLVGGFRSTMEWIEIAESMGIGWWITSALESNIGLNAICQFTSRYKIKTHQGLGTGQLYENNIPSPLAIEGENILYMQDGNWDLTRVAF